ncbi:ABC transporter ATP-binding protein [Archaeoglobus profundus]|uniref:ABC transporter related protein n=1 Tax=Archaeoglobus profundus (strain DSM 5631 / JCM 9629 / NBRC 100127 / Av18) TaxID=572546 RepID=D2RHD1_ARCPA|nr:ABC transporter ATP-binding protein [Archaeoglobus profundus]ADB57706.1 ABC transporter related protein [Archaeoglobus profundus DSM 5631]
MIELEDVWKRFKKEWILKSVNLRLNGNGLFAILGENGSGKTTLLKIMCGLIKPNRGRVRILGIDLRKDKSYKRYIGVLLHENVLYEELTVEENLKFYAKAYGCYSEIARNMSKRLGLDKYMSAKVKDLSFGWKKRANLVRALLNDPKVVLLDEPFSGLDESARIDVCEILKELSKDRIVIFTTPVSPEIDCKVFRLEKGVLHAGIAD